MINFNFNIKIKFFLRLITLDKSKYGQSLNYIYSIVKTYHVIDHFKELYKRIKTFPKIKKKIFLHSSFYIVCILD